MTEDLQEILWQAERLPYGKARSRALEAVALRADGVDLDIAFAARLQLARSYVMGGERRKMLVPFAWCVAESDKDPARFAEDQHSLLWAFKFVGSTLVRFPEVALDMTLATLDDMERRYRLAGKSQHAVHMYRHVVARHVGDQETAQEQFRLWLSAPRDDLSDCRGCDPSGKVEHLSALGQHAEAVALARPVLEGTVTCSEQPQEMQAMVLESLVAEGLFEEAAQAHRAGYRRSRGLARNLEQVTAHVRFCAATGNEMRALEIVDAHLPLIDDADSSYARMTFGAAAAANVARAKMIRTITRTRLSPKRSPIAPTIGASTAAANRYDVRIQPVTATDVSKCSPNTGNAGTSMVCMSE